MKKSIKLSVIATTAMLALAGTFMGCQQPVAPTVDKAKLTDKDIFEQQIATPTIRGTSFFGRNVLEFSDVNYADRYVLYRFGPTGDFKTAQEDIKGKEITIDTTKDATYDGFVIEDKVSKSNPMVAGQYTYKLIAKSAVKNSARSVDLSGNKANQDYWANPSVDVSWLPAVCSTTVTVTPENMPKWGTKMPAPRKLVEGVDFYRGKVNNNLIDTSVTSDINTIYFNPELDVSVVYAVAEGIDDCFENSKDNSTVSDLIIKTYTNNGLYGKKSLVLPSTATSYKLYAYNTWDDPIYYPNSDKVLVKEGILSQNANVKVDVKWTQQASGFTNATTKEKYQYGFTYTLSDNVPASNYKIVAQRAEVTEEPVLGQYVTKIEDVVLTEVYKTNDVAKKTTTYYVVDKTAVEGKKYQYYLGGTYGTTGRIQAATYTHEYVKAESNMNVNNLLATLVTKLPGEKDLIRENVKVQVKFEIPGVYTDFAAKKITTDIDSTKVSKDISITKQENLGTTYIHFEDTLDWDKNGEKALLPVYIFTYKQGYNYYTSKVTFERATDSKFNVIDVNNNTTKIGVTKITENDDKNNTNTPADVIDTYRLLYKVDSFAVSTAALAKSTDSLEVKYTIKAAAANNGKPDADTLKTVADKRYVEYKINYLVVDAITGQKYKAGLVSVPKFDVEQKFNITGLDKNTNYRVIYTLCTEVYNSKGVKELSNVVVGNGLDTNPVKKDATTNPNA